jgi:membrane-bound lytic murein transglycosylase D
MKLFTVVVLCSALVFAFVPDAPAEPFGALPPEAVAWLSQELLQNRSRFILEGLDRSERYADFIWRTLERAGLPLELASIPLVESGYQPLAEGPDGSKGMWQFQPVTARQFGLKVDDWSDERFDPHKSTLAAAAYLNYLYTRFKRWPLVVAAYNCGHNRIARLLEETGATTFQELAEKAVLPRLTIRYVYSVAALSAMIRRPDRYGLPRTRLSAFYWLLAGLPGKHRVWGR